MRLSDENLRGRTVIGADGQAIGEVAALFLDSDAWGIQSIQVKLRKEIADQLGATRTVFHAGTAVKDGQLVTAGGRVLSVVGRGADFEQAIARAYAGVNMIGI